MYFFPDYDILKTVISNTVNDKSKEDEKTICYTPYGTAGDT